SRCRPRTACASGLRVRWSSSAARRVRCLEAAPSPSTRCWSRAVSEAKARVRRFLAFAARVVDRADPLGIQARRRLRETSGLSAEGVELALDHLEHGAGDADLEAFVRRAEPAESCAVVLSANVCTAALRAIAFAAAT